MRIKTKIALVLITVLALFFGMSTPAQAAVYRPSADFNFQIGFNNAAPVGKVDSTYPNAWQPYPDGMSGKYYSDSIISLHDGMMDVNFDGTKRGAAGTFGTSNGAWGHIGGVFSMKAKMTGATTNGVAVMLWPTSDHASDGEIDYPEGNLSSDTYIFHHKMTVGHESESYNYNLGNQWKAWHIYSILWEPGKYVRYYLDDKLVYTVTKDVPTTAHRYMFQTSGNGSKGHFLIDFVRTTE